MSLSHGSLAMQFSQDQKEHKVQLAQGSAIVRLVDIGPQDKKWAKGIFAPDSGEVSNQATFVWPDDSGSFDLHELFEKHQQRQIEEGRLVPSGINIVVYQIRSAGVGATKWKASAMPLDWQPKQVVDLFFPNVEAALEAETTPLEKRAYEAQVAHNIMKAASRALAMDPSTAEPWTCNGVVLEGKRAHMMREMAIEFGVSRNKRILLDKIVGEFLSVVEDHLRDQAIEKAIDANPF